MTLVEKLSDVRDFRKILETTVKEIGENYSSEICQIILSNPLDTNFTSICEYIANPEEVQDGLPSTTFPLHLEGGGLGLLSVSRENNLSKQEIDEIRITLANIGDILRYAQINDLVQRDTFRNAFMAEITNLMKLNMGLGDALFMVVNILGKALGCSRCIFVCVDDMHTDWKSYEYYQRERGGIISAQQFGFPSKDSAIVSQTLLSASPIISFEGQPNSYKTPVQEEMEFIGVRSQVSVAIRSSVAVHGAIMVQHCDSRHAWTRDEIDIVQSAADTVAEALAQVPEEMKEIEPIMRLHQNEVADTKVEGAKSMQEVRKSLKRTMSHVMIKAANTTKQSAAEQQAKTEPPPPPPPPPEAAPPPPPAAIAPAESFAPQTPSYDQAFGAPAEPDYAAAEEALQDLAPAYAEQPGFTYDLTEYDSPQAGYGQEESSGQAQADQAAAAQASAFAAAEYAEEHQAFDEAAAMAEIEAFTQSGGKSWGAENEAPAGGLQEADLGGLASALEDQAQEAPAAAANQESSNYKGVLGGLLGNQRDGRNNAGAWDIEATFEQPPAPPAGAQQANPMEQAAEPVAAGAGKWGDLDSIPAPGAAGKPAAQAQQQAPQARAGGLAGALAGAAPAPRAGGGGGGYSDAGGSSDAGSSWGELDSIPAPGAPKAPPPSKGPSKWGDLDAIPAPNKSGAPAPQQSNDWAAAQQNEAPAPASGGGGGGLSAMMLGKAKASAVGQGGLLGSLNKGGVKPPAPPSFVDGPPIQIDEAAAEAKLKQILASSNPTSDYIFATPGIDMRLLGRIDSWVSQVEAKDKHTNGHVRAVAEYATAVARVMQLSPEEVTQIRLAAIIHDVGKLGLPQQILQKPEEELNDAELLMTMNHTLDGAKLVEGFPELAALAPIILAHHEEYGGEGYPSGLAGEDIPLPARIIHACNAYAEMVSDLVYRAAMPPEQAQNEMIRSAGKVYDPNVVQALIACISQGLVAAKVV